MYSSEYHPYHDNYIIEENLFKFFIPPEGVAVVIENDTVTVTNQTVDIETAEDDTGDGDTGDGDTGEEDSPEEGE